MEEVFMAWLILCEDSAGGPSLRADAALMDALWAFECANRDKLLLAGSLRKDDRVTKDGSLFLIDTETREEAERFLESDPATIAGLRGKVEIRWLNVAILNRTVLD